VPTPRSTTARAALAAALLAAIGAPAPAAALSSRGARAAPTGPAASAPPAPTPAADAAPGASPQARALGAALDAILAEAPLSGARAGVVVASLRTGEVLYARNPDVLLNPASNVKLVTTAAALARLGPAYRFETEVLADPTGGAARALYVRGKGDPSLVTERLWALAADLRLAGVTKVGDLVVDESWFDGERIGPGFDQEEGDRSYLAPSGAASLNFNTVAIHVAPGDRPGQRGRVAVEPASGFLELVNRTTTVRASARRHLVPSSQPLPGGRQRIVVEGRLPAGSRPQAIWRRIDEPALYLGHTLAALLELRGVQVTGKVRVGSVPAGARLVHVAESEPLAEIVRYLNKGSNNFVAEQLLRTLGAELRGSPGTWGKGVAAVEDFLAEVGIPRGAYVMRNGSGLNDANRFSARQLVTLLRFMWGRFRVGPEYAASLPVAGHDGTLRWRLEGTDADGRVRAKTGTLENVTSLSGYVEGGADGPLAFAVIVNDFPGRAGSAVRAVDALGSALAAAGGPPGELDLVVARARAPAARPVPAAAGDLAPAVRAYAALGRQGDRRNVNFLRGALRAEAEPALRLAIAEALYLSAPDSEAARRALLETVAAEPAALDRLAAIVAADGAAPPAEAPGGGPAADAAAVPVLGPLADLAAEGGAEALQRLVEVAPAYLRAGGPAAPGPLGAAVADALAGVAAAAPEELALALRAAPAPGAEAAVAALADGLARADAREGGLAALRALAGKGDGDGPAAARALLAQLEAADAARAAARTPPAAPAMGPAPARVSPP
jgi:D-alanyl-D-alanine carboxypeptidase/D-alanyl-D-alanine-endopeptidase (penicillin-binding protein 4)